MCDHSKKQFDQGRIELAAVLAFCMYVVLTGMYLQLFPSIFSKKMGQVSRFPMMDQLISTPLDQWQLKLLR